MGSIKRIEDLRFDAVYDKSIFRPLYLHFSQVFALAILGLTLGLLPLTATAQVKYTPEHPEVRAMADAGVAFLNTTLANQTLHYRTLAALAIVEHGKRYHGRAPRDNTLVKGAVDDILADIDGLIANEGEMYYPSLAVILLAETNAQAHREEIKKLLRFIESRQEVNGSFTYKRESNTSDTSQTQFAALAMFVAKHHGFNPDVQMAKRTLQWILASQQQQGNWVYKLAGTGAANDPGRPKGTISSLSMHAAGLSTAYLLSDFLQLNKRAKSMNKALGKRQVGLPRTVSIYVKPVGGDDALIQRSGPLVPFDRGRLSNGTRAGNIYLTNQFRVEVSSWNNYYLYALERYAYFREQSEGDVGDGVLATWYDQTVDHLRTTVKGDGSFTSDGREAGLIATSFAVLVLVRSSEVINQPPITTTLLGARGFETDAILREGRNGVIRQVKAEKNLQDLIDGMKDGEASQAQLQDLSDSLKKQIVEFRQKDDKSRGEIKAFLQSMISASNYFRRLISVRFLAAEQDMDNVPALIYALGDPDFRICLEAHDGLRLISRKVDSMKISPQTRKDAKRDKEARKADEENNCRFEFDSIKRKWTDWFLKIRPDAELLD